MQKHGIMEPLLECLRDPAVTYSTKGLVAWAVRAIVTEHPSNQARILPFFFVLRTVCK